MATTWVEMTKRKQGPPFVCEICGESWPTGQKLGGHMRKHQAERMRQRLAAGPLAPASDRAPFRQALVEHLSGVDLAATLRKAERQALLENEVDLLARTAGEISPRFYRYRVDTDAGFTLALRELVPRLRELRLQVISSEPERALFIRRV